MPNGAHFAAVHCRTAGSLISLTGVFNPLSHLTAARGSPLSLALPHGGGRGPVLGAVICITRSRGEEIWEQNEPKSL